MLKYSLAFFVLFFILDVSFSQSKLVPGAYRNCVDFRNSITICSDSDLVFKLKKKAKIDFLYKVKSSRKGIKRSTLNNGIWGIVHDGNFYLNARRIGMANGYIKIYISGNFLYFKGLPLKHPAQNVSLANTAISYGLIGAAVESAYVITKTKHMVHYILNLNSGMVNLLTENYVKRVLQAYPSLLMEFEQDESTNSISRLKSYIEKVNKLES